jgi:hypothetical protein
MSDTRISGFAGGQPAVDSGGGSDRRVWTNCNRNTPTRLVTNTNTTQASGGNQPILREAVQISAEQQFNVLAEQWHNETGSHSSMTLRRRHPAYKAIVTLGWAAVPALLNALVAKPDFWFPILRDITGENPVPPEERGFYDLMTDRWRVWGKQKGLLM